MSARTFIIATVGTSLLQGLRRELGLAADQRPGDKQALETLRRLGPQAKACGAEINSLTNLMAGQQLSSGTVTPPFGIRFLVSDTDDGRWVGQVLQEHFRHVRDAEQVDWEVIEGLDGFRPGAEGQTDHHPEGDRSSAARRRPSLPAAGAVFLGHAGREHPLPEHGSALAGQGWGSGRDH
jgi:hypothetical protein